MRSSSRITLRTTKKKTLFVRFEALLHGLFLNALLLFILTNRKIKSLIKIIYITNILSFNTISVVASCNRPINVKADNLN